jgi:hypothetical protein
MEVPAEVDLSAADPIAAEGQDLRVARSPAVGAGRLVGHEHLATDLDQARESPDT